MQFPTAGFPLTSSVSQSSVVSGPSHYQLCHLLLYDSPFVAIELRKTMALWVCRRILANVLVCHEDRLCHFALRYAAESSPVMRRVVEGPAHHVDPGRFPCACL